jgi:hypothetical protein
MIPKIIHYCWLSDDLFPEDVKTCIASWKKHLSDYEFILWNFDRFDINSSLWVQQAFENKKYAFAADYIRLYALYHYGGIYVDADVEVLKPFDDLLDLPYFIGKEHSDDGCCPEPATMGAEKGCFWIGKCLEHYVDRRFIKEDGQFDMAVLPGIMQRIILQSFRIQSIADKKEFINNNQTVCIFPTDYFNPKNYMTKKLNVTNNTYSIHHYAGSWLPNDILKQKIGAFLLSTPETKQKNNNWFSF